MLPDRIVVITFHYIIYMYPIIILYTCNLYNVVCGLYLNKTGEEGREVKIAKNKRVPGVSPSGAG